MTEWRDRKRYTEVLAKRMAHVESGEGDPVLFLHGNPTSSYLWREVMAAMAGAGRLLAPDLIGMGDSDKLDDPGPDSYRFVEHRDYLDAWIDAVVPEGRITLVIHDWGSALGFHWAEHNRERVRAIAYMEAIVRPISWDEWPERIRALFQAMRSEAGEAMILEKNIFVERILPGSILRKLSEAEMAEYRRPFLNPGEDRRPTLTWPRQIPLDGEPADVAEIVAGYCEWLTGSNIPKLFVNAEPGAILTGPMRETARGFAKQTEVTVRGSHFIQEDSGQEIGREIMQWIKTLA
ncbi:MAG: haloalkane dehalogenase [Proteobacteria bacterium]|nr:haloalkane dehalogenase [Pseudomonadota bacterium]